MDFEEFKNTIMDLVSKEVEDRGLEDISMKLTTIDSPDGMTDRLMVSVGDSKMSMAFRLKEIYGSVQDGEDIDHAVYKMVNTIEDSISVIKNKEQDVKSFISDYEKVKDHTYLRMIPGDSPILKDTPHKMVEDMALVVNIHLESFSDENGRSCVVVSKPLMEMYGIDEKQLFADAEKNSLANEPIVFTPLGDMIKNLIESENLPSPEEAGIVTYIATNKSGFQGAAVAGYPDFCEKAAETIGGSFYMLPSSVHEFILIKDDGMPKAKDLNAMIKNVNETVLEPRDILSAQCYHYDAKNKVLETGLKYANKIQQRKGGTR
jgi:hypothetical protein